MDKDYSNISREASDDMNKECMPRIIYVISKMLPGGKRVEALVLHLSELTPKKSKISPLLCEI